MPVFSGGLCALRINVLSEAAKNVIHEHSLRVLEEGGVSVKNDKARRVLENAGCTMQGDRVLFPSSLVMDYVRKAPSSFSLFSRDDRQPVTVGDGVLFNPGSSAPLFRESESGTIRRGTVSDVVNLTRVVEQLQNIRAQSTALIPSDVPSSVSDFMRLFVVLLNSEKPIITGAFSKEGLKVMLEMLSLDAGDAGRMRDRPRAIFDCCPLSPLTWGDVAGQNLIDCAEAGVPVEVVPAPLMGATSPVTLEGTLIQANAECLSGVVMTQIVSPGTPVIYGGAPGIMDMIHATPSFASMETALVASANAEMGRFYDLPTQAYLGTTDSHLNDMQAGIEAGVGLAIGGLSGINVISGPGMLGSLNCQSLEKLVIDNEICGAVYKLIEGINGNDMDEVTELILGVGPGGNFLGKEHTRRNLRSHQFMPSEIVNRLSSSGWTDGGKQSMTERASERVHTLLESERHLAADEGMVTGLRKIVEEAYEASGIPSSSVPNVT
ncbi:MAG: trimethylamine methyltransferase family protein [Candidatus Thorarchaeota archaeon]